MIVSDRDTRVYAVVDARGHRCPTPTLRLARALQAAPAGGLIRLLADDPLARIDIPHFLAGAGHTLVRLEVVDGVLEALVEKAAVHSRDGA